MLPEKLFPPLFDMLDKLVSEYKVVVYLDSDYLWLDRKMSEKISKGSGGKKSTEK